LFRLFRYLDLSNWFEFIQERVMAKKERVVVKGNRLVEAIRELISRGDARRVCVLNEEKHLLDIPITTTDPASPANALEAPVLAAIRTLGSLLNECTVEVERAKRPKKT
jgi:hypothetical protein